jgi:hypothetical protein
MRRYTERAKPKPPLIGTRFELGQPCPKNRADVFSFSSILSRGRRLVEGFRRYEPQKPQRGA